MTRICRFCDSGMELISGGGLEVDTWECRLCGCVESFGLERLPSPERIRKRADGLEELADEIENSRLAHRLEVAT